VEVKTAKGIFVASCPSGASTGSNEALELRDDDKRGVSRAIANVNEIIAPALIGKNPANQREIDDAMIALDGTENKSKLGANAMLPVSMAAARAGAASKGVPLYKHIAELSENKNPLKASYPLFNILNGGAHAKNDLEIQEFMVAPQKKLFSENLALGSKIFQRLTDLLVQQFGSAPALGDEGGYAPLISKAEQALFMIKNAIANESDVSIALDCAASEFYHGGKYEVEEGKQLSRNEMAEFYKDLASRFPIISIEDPFDEDDWEGFKEIHAALADTVIVGDDLTTINVKRIKEAETKKACNGVIIKLNQIGTVAETIEAVKLAQSYGWKIIVSHRSGETLDTFIADLCVGTGADFLKSGSPAKEERMVKYQRLLEIEDEINTK
ncbi:MAG: phosphopyruvate hydratase, partial [Candidatus Saccharimonadales bacterium]